MTFELPAVQQDTATHLRELEQSAPKTLPLNIRAALIQAATEIETREAIALFAANAIEEAANVRISEMASTSLANEIHRGVKSTLLEVARRLRECK